jgi:hypothetical protein
MQNRTLSSLLFCIVCCLTACVSAANKDRKNEKRGTGGSESDETQNRPDSEGITPPGWYLAGAKITDFFSFNGASSTSVEEVGLRYQSCSFVELGGVKTFQWYFSDVDLNDTTFNSDQKALNIWLETASLPAAGSHWNIDQSTGEPQRVGYDVIKQSTAFGIWSTLVEHSSCALDVTNQYLTASQEVDSPTMKSMAIFFLQGRLTCLRLPKTGSKMEYLKFVASVGCNGLLIEPKEVHIDPITVRDSATGNEWAFTSFGNFPATEQSCNALGSGYRIPTSQEFKTAERFLLASKLVAVFKNAPLGSSFAWTSNEYVLNGDERAEYVEYSTDTTGTHEALEVVIGKSKERYQGASICIKTK